MVASWRNIFRPSQDAKSSDPDPADSQPPGEDIRGEYRALLASELRQIGVPPDCVHLEVGQKLLDDGRQLCNVKLRIVRWDRDAVLRLLVRLPLLEARTRRAVGASWLAEASQFAGIWLHSSGALPVDQIERDSEWAISELQLVDGGGATAAQRLRTVVGTSAA